MGRTLIVGLRALRFAAFVQVLQVAHAEPPPQRRLQYVRAVGAEACPDAAALRAAVAERLGYDPFDAAANSTVVARISRQDNQLFGAVELVDERGTSRGKRELTTEGAECGEMARAMALSISIAMDPENTEERHAAATGLPVRKEPIRDAPTPAPRSVTPLRDERAASGKTVPPRVRRSSAYISLSALSTLGVAPTAAFGGAFAVQRKQGSWSLAVGAQLARSPNAGVEGTAELHATLAAGELAACFQHSVLEYCLAGLLGAVAVRGSQVAIPRTDVGAFGALGGRLGIVAPLSRAWSLVSQAEALAVVSPVRARIDDAIVWKAPSVSVTLASGLRLRFW